MPDKDSIYIVLSLFGILALLISIFAVLNMPLSGINGTNRTNGTIGSQGIQGIAGINGTRLTDGLVAYYPFDEKAGYNTYDWSGNANNGINYGATITTGKFGNALSFNGVNNYINILHSSSLNLSNTNMVICVWVKISAYAYSIIVNKGTNGGVNDGYILFLDGSGKINFASRYSGESGWVTGLVSVPLNEWIFIVGLRNNTLISVYYNTVFDNSGVASGLIPVNTQNIHIGFWSAYGLYTVGLYDDIRIYNHALSLDEISNIYNLGVLPHQSLQQVILSGNVAVGIGITDLTISHGLGILPDGFNVIPSYSTVFYATVDATNIYVTLITAPIIAQSLSWTVTKNGG